MFDIPYFLVFLVSVISLVLGYLWYGKWFKAKWLEIIGATAVDLETRKKMEKESMHLYVIQFVMTFVQMTMLAILVSVILLHPIITAILIWVAFIVPTIAASSMWTNDPKHIVKARFLIQIGYQLFVFIVAGFVFSFWL